MSLKLWMVSLFMAIQGFLSSKHNITLRAGIGKNVRKMLALNVLQNILFRLVGLYSIAESTTKCPILDVHQILIKILRTCNLTYKHNENNSGTKFGYYKKSFHYLFRMSISVERES